MKVFLMLALLVSFNANAAVRVYEPSTGEEQNVNYLVKQGAVIPEMGELTRDDLKKMDKMQFIEYMKQVPDENKPIDKQKLTGLGSVFYFVDFNSVDSSTTSAMNSISEIKDVKTVFYLKPPRSASSMPMVGLKTKGKLKVDLTLDSSSKNARRLHVSKYPIVIYIAPDGSKARFSGSKGGVMALKMKIGEVKALLELEAREKAY